VLTPGTVARRAALLEAGAFDERFMRAEDFHLWLKLAFRERRIAYNRALLVRHRRRAGSLASNRSAMLQAFIQVVSDLDRRLPLTPAQRAIVARQVALRQSELAVEAGKHHFIDGNYGAAASALRRATALEPRRWHQLRLRAVHAAVCMAPRPLRRLYDALRAGRSAEGLHQASR
jgi:hypothetical protein